MRQVCRFEATIGLTCLLFVEGIYLACHLRGAAGYMVNPRDGSIFRVRFCRYEPVWFLGLVRGLDCSLALWITLGGMPGWGC